MQSKQLSTNDVAVVELDAVAIICAKKGSKIHGIRPLNTMTVGDAYRTLCKQKETVQLYIQRMVRETPAFYSK